MGGVRNLPRTIAYAVCTLALSLTAACGSGGEAAPDADGATASPKGSAPSPSPSTADGRVLPMTPSPDGAARAITREVLGTVSARQGECLLFTPGDMAETWVLAGATTGLEVGEGYTLTGAMDDTTNAACPQGPTFIVSASAPAS